MNLNDRIFVALEEMGLNLRSHTAGDIRWQAVFFIGTAGSGKSFVRDNRYLTHAGFRSIDPDKIKKRHPDYDPEKPFEVHQWSQEVAMSQFKQIINAGNGDSVIVDGTGRNLDKMRDLIGMAGNAGYRTFLVYVWAPLEVSLFRNRNRTRFVPEDMIMLQSASIERNFGILRGMVDKYKVIENFSHSELRLAQRDMAVYPPPQKERPPRQGEEILERAASMNTKAADKVFDITTVDEWVRKLQDGIKAPVVGVSESTLGGQQNVSILIMVSVDERKDWANGILENSHYFRLHLLNDGVIEMFSGWVKPARNFRRTRVTSAEDAIAKINRYAFEVERAKTINKEAVAAELVKIAKSLAVTIVAEESNASANLSAGVTPGVPDGTGPHGRQMRKHQQECPCADKQVAGELVKIAKSLVAVSAYGGFISDVLRSLRITGIDPRHVEAYMRLDHGTLDSLSRSDFVREAKEIVPVIMADVKSAERLAKSYGL